MSNLIDQPARNRFEQGHDVNISVIAPAGVGKTTAIVNRIVHLARLPEAEAVERLQRLVVVTYSVRAAQQMQQRARSAIRAAAVSSRIQRAFQRTFFGTIHSFCVRLLDRFGHYLGLPSPVGLLQDEEEIWQRFLLRGLDSSLGSDPHLGELFHFYSPVQLYDLGRALPPGDPLLTSPLPELDIERLLAFKGEGLKGPTKASIAKAQERTRQWHHAWMLGQRFRPLPGYPPSALAEPYAHVWRETFAPLHAWLHDTTRAFGRRVANAYERFRLSEAVMTYDDQVRLALKVLHEPAAQRELAEDRYSVLLDEAQDTDPHQFEVLRRVAGLGEGMEQPEAQNFSIVGDFQQAIYAPRSDLATYQAVHDQIRTGTRGTTSRLEVTFRCDTAIIDFVNRIFPDVLNQTDGQCNFERLVARSGAGPGQVVRLECPDLPQQEDGTQPKSPELYQHEAVFIAQRIQELGFAGLGARSWSQVAILCPRKNWLLDLQHALIELGLRVQLHSSDETPRDRMPGSWLTALIWVAAHPEDTFEIAGVLREVFGVADGDMALFTDGHGDRLRLDRPLISSPNPVSHALAQLREAVFSADSKPLDTAVRHLLDKTRLRERLCSIPGVDPADIDRELDVFHEVICSRAAGGATLAELAEELHAGLSLPVPAEEEIHEGAIQMMTSHKAKGLEWDAVIAPYLFRRIEWKSSSYPRVVSLGADDLIICRDKDEYATRASGVVDLRERQQCQRLYYVMFTRAKRTLVLFDDEVLMAKQIKGRSGEIPGNFLQFQHGPNRETFLALPTSFSLLPEAQTIPSSPVAIAPAQPSLSASDVKRALQQAAQFPRRTTPHALAVHVRDEAEPEIAGEREDHRPAAADNPGILYGTWWHEFVQTIPWEKSDSAWQKKFVQAREHSPQPERSTREWNLFRQSKLAQWLPKKRNLVHVEFPFLWLESDSTCLEGIIDLAVFSAAESIWHVIDWKTNRLGLAGADGMVETYRGQIRAYVRALQEMLSAEVRGSLYLTDSGDWVPID
jgi:ATP-dependent helicase/nuclease subunit A